MLATAIVFKTAKYLTYKANSLANSLDSPSEGSNKPFSFFAFQKEPNVDKVGDESPDQIF
jgi:hypothetical protein